MNLNEVLKVSGYSSHGGGSLIRKYFTTQERETF